MTEIINVVIVAILIVINGFFVACEFAMVKIRNSRIETLISEGNIRAKYCRSVKENLNSCLSACQLGITLCSLGLGWMGESTISKLILPVMKILKFSESITHGISIAISFIIITMLEVVIGELVPKALALYNTEKIMLNTSLLLLGFYKLMYPIIYLFNSSTNLFLKPFGYSQAEEIDDPHTGNELRLLLEESYRSGLIDESEQQLVDNAFEFGDKMVREIMIPRTDMICIKKNYSEERIFSIIEETGYTRYPVVEKDKDDILGFVHIKDLYNQKFKQNQINIENILREIIYVPEMTAINKLFEKLKKEKSQIAVVIDEYGGTSGLVTIEDVLEEIVGDIQDEFDKEILDIKQINDNTYIINGRTSINEINEYFDIDIEHNGFDSIGGWLYYKLGANIKVNQSINYKNYKFTVEKLNKLRVENLVVIRINNAIENL